MDLTIRLRGKRIAEVLTNGHALKIVTDDGAEVNVIWVNDNGEAINGKPVVAQHGLRLQARGVRDLIHVPGNEPAVRRPLIARN